MVRDSLSAAADVVQEKQTCISLNIISLQHLGFSDTRRKEHERWPGSGLS